MSDQASSSSDLQTAQPGLALPNGTAQAQPQLRALPMTALPASSMPSVDMTTDDRALPHGTAIPQSPKSSPPSKTRRQESPIQQAQPWPMPPNISALQLSVSSHALEATNNDPSHEQGGARPHGPARQLDGSLNQIRTALPESRFVPSAFRDSQTSEDERVIVHQQEAAGVALADSSSGSQELEFSTPSLIVKRTKQTIVQKKFRKSIRPYPIRASKPPRPPGYSSK